MEHSQILNSLIGNIKISSIGTVEEVARLVEDVVAWSHRKFCFLPFNTFCVEWENGVEVYRGFYVLCYENTAQNTV